MQKKKKKIIIPTENTYQYPRRVILLCDPLLSTQCCSSSPSRPAPNIPPSSVVRPLLGPRFPPTVPCTPPLSLPSSTTNQENRIEHARGHTSSASTVHSWSARPCRVGLRPGPGEDAGAGGMHPPPFQSRVRRVKRRGGSGVRRCPSPLTLDLVVSISLGPSSRGSAV